MPPPTCCLLHVCLRVYSFVHTQDKLESFKPILGKWNVYDTDLRIPLYARGPGVTPGSKLSHLGSNVDIMPTILDIAGASSTPASMDGRSFAPLLQSGPSVGSMEGKSWRTQLLVEYYGLGDVVR